MTRRELRRNVGEIVMLVSVQLFHSWTYKNWLVGKVKEHVTRNM